MPKLFFNNPVKKNFTVAGVLRINIWFSIPVPKIKFDPPHKEKCFGAYILGIPLNQKKFPDVEISLKN